MYRTERNAVSAEIARTLKPSASSGATLARLVSWALRASDAANRVVSAFMAYFTASDKRGEDRLQTMSWPPFRCGVFVLAC